MARDYPKKVQKFADGGLVDEDGNPPSNNFRELRSPESWARKRKEEGYKKRDREIEADGASGRSIGEHLKAGVRAVFEPKEWRAIYEEGGKRDKANPLYDRKRVPRDED